MPELISTLLILSLNLTLMLGGLQTFMRYHSVLTARSTLRKLDYTLALARAQALVLEQELKVCPRSQGWQTGWSIENKQQEIIKQVSNSANGIIHLQIFNNTNSCINILSNGMSYNNGHFTYRAQSLLYNIQEHLVFNQGMRTYWLDGNNLAYPNP